MTIFSDGVPFEPEVPDLQPEAFLEIARGDADRIEGLHVLQRLLDLRDRPLAHRRDLLDRGHQVAVVIQVADDGAADLLDRLVFGLHRQLPEQMVGERRGRRQRVLDRRQFLDFGRRPRPVAVVQVVAEEVVVVGVVPGIRLLDRGLRFLLLGLLLLGGLQLLGGDFLEQRVLHHLLVQQIGKLER